MKAKPYLYDTFLCHNSKDKPIVELVEGQLRARGVRCWLDRYELRPGNQWQQFVNAEWPRIASIILCFGPNGISPGQQYEIENLIPAAKISQNIIPIILQDVNPLIDPKELIPKSLQNRLWIDFRNNKFNPVDALLWGIKGENPFIRLSIGNYYKETDGQEDNDLKLFLGELISKNTKVLGYVSETRKAITKLFEDPDNAENIILFHNGESVSKKNYLIGNNDIKNSWNLDHIWPKAFGYFENRQIISDLHNICPANMIYNSKRSAGFFYDRRLDFITKKMEIIPERQFDPRGVIARACLYMVVRYQGKNNEPELILDERPAVIQENHLGSLETILYWNKLAPVSTAERKRNDMIAEIQGNRNPFVDRPEFADLIWYPI